MNFQKILLPVLGVVVVVVGYRAYGWEGVAIAVTGIVMWALLHFTRIMRVMQRAATQPVGFVASAVMLNARLRPGVNLLHVMAMTRTFGQDLGVKGEQPEVYRWTDAGGSYVTCEFRNGKLVKWELVRPTAESGEGSAPAP